ncbi:unnamed protein product [Calypogeia fissa]
MSLLSRLCTCSLVSAIGRRKTHPRIQLSNSQAKKRSRNRAALAGRGAGGAAAAMANNPAGGGAAAKVVVLYHYPCPDGVFAALAAHLYHAAIGCPALFLPNTVYQPLRIQDLKVEGVDVFYLLDFVGPEGFALELARHAKQVVILDHHKTALDSLPQNGEGPQNLHCVLDMNRSGATISYDYFEEKLLSSRTDVKGFPRYSARASLVPTNTDQIKSLFRYIEDADLWRWVLPDSKAFSSGLSDMSIELSALANPKVFGELLDLKAEELITKGKESLKAKQAAIHDVLKTSFPVELGRGRYGQCLAVHGDTITHLRSELGNQLAAKSLEHGLRPIGAVVYVQLGFYASETQYKVSLRSMGENADTTEISQAYGGGGHRNASAFMIGREELELWKVKP